MNNIKKLQAQKVKSTGDLPAPRFGHTFNILGQSKAVLFGGAVSEDQKFIITNDTFIFDFTNKRWKKINNAKGNIPPERAAHASAPISSTELAIYGGAASGQQGLLKDDLFILDLKNTAEPVWKVMQIANKQDTPGTRYGHVMVYSRPYLVVFGGNTGSRTENDTWIINVSKNPTVWMRCAFDSKLTPCPRVYHSGALCTEGRGAGMVVIYGGRKETKTKDDFKDSALNDVWGLVRHSNGVWEWIQPPKSPNYSPIGRYQHLVAFMGTYMVITGGRTNPPDENTSVMEIYDMQESVWRRTTLNTMFDPVKRHRHAGVVIGTNLVIHGGFGPETNGQPSEALLCVDLANIVLNKEEIQNNNINVPETPSRMGISRQLEPLREEDRNAISNNSRITTKARQRDLTPTRMLTSARAIKLSNQVLVAKDDFNKMKIERVPVNNLLEESKRLTIQPTGTDFLGGEYELVDQFLGALLPQQGQARINTNLFPFQRQKVMKLCKDTCKQLQSLPASVVYIRAPVKVFGSLYGRYYELLRLFETFGTPDEHEMETFTYVFLGNYVDKGFNSLQTICLLMALKLKYPDHIVLLRGSHEDSVVNKVYGFAEECSIRMNQNVSQIHSIYNNINRMFELLPLAAVIEDKLICVHSSVGSAVSLSDIESIPRPLKVSEDKRAIQMLWAGSENSFYGNVPSPCQTKLGEFLDSHDLSTVIRSKECLMDGFLQEGNTISIFSVANYGKLGNHSSILKISKNLAMTTQKLQPVTTLRGGWISDQNLKTQIQFSEEELNFRKKMFSPPRKK